MDEINEVVEKFLHPFLRATGYGRHDILAFNFQTGLISTRNGGIYKLIEDKVKWVKGPPVYAEERI